RGLFTHRDARAVRRAAIGDLPPLEERRTDGGEIRRPDFVVADRHLLFLRPSWTRGLCRAATENRHDAHQRHRLAGWDGAQTLAPLARESLRPLRRVLNEPRPQ